MAPRKRQVRAGALIDVATTLGPVNIAVDALDRGLAVHPGLDGEGYRVTHVPSGRKLADFKTKRAALSAMRGLLQLMSWDRPHSDVSAVGRATTAKVLACIARYGGKSNG